MVDCRHLLRPLFYVNTLVGLSTVDPRTWERSNVRRAYACLWVCVYVAELSAHAYSYLTTVEVGYFEMFDLTANHVTGIYLLAQGVFDHRTALAAALGLEAVRDRADAEGVPATSLDPAYTVALVLGSANLVLVGAHAARAWTAATSTHFMAMQTAHAITYLSYMFAVLQAEQGMNGVLVASVGSEPALRTRVLKFLRETRGALVRLRDDVHAHFQAFLVLRFFFVCIALPRTVHSALCGRPAASDPVGDLLLTSSLVIVSSYCFFVLRVHARIAATGPEAQTILYEHILAAHTHEEKKELRRQTLACLHRRHRPDCWVFRLEFGLIMTLIDTGLLVFLATNGASEIKA